MGNEFKKVKENFTSIGKNLENSEVKEWLESTKETLMGERDSKSKGDEENKLKAVLARFDALVPKVQDTNKACDSLWKAYQYTDELTPHMEWLTEKKVLATRDINSNSAGETEELIEKQEKVIDQLDKKRKVFQEIIAKGSKLKDDPKSPEFLGREVKKASELWEETNKLALDRLNRLRDNLSAWERYESKRNDLADKLAAGDRELDDIKKVYDLTAGEADHKNRLKTAVTIRKDIEGVFKAVDDANNIVQVLLTEDMKAELNEQVSDLEAWTGTGRKRMDELLNPPAPIEAEDRVLQTMELGEDIREQLEIHQTQQNLWNSELAPTQAGEDSAESKDLVLRMDKVNSLLSGLNDESEAEAAKFGEDVKHLADVTNSTKKFDPWIAKSETSVKEGMKKASSLGEANTILGDLKKWQEESEKMKKTLDNGNEAAHKMTMHEEADRVYAANCKKWEAVSASIKDLITKMEAIVKTWESQAATADKVTAALSAPAASDMKLEDLEAHLNSLKQMFIEKQKMMDSLNPSA